MKRLEGTQTAANLARAFAGESQARNRYTFYASVARKEGHANLAAVFAEIAENERAHARAFFDLIIEGLGNVNAHVDAGYPFALGNTSENLQYAADGEKEEWTEVYPSFADIAKSEGYPEVEFIFRKIAVIEKDHEEQFRGYKKKLDSQTLYKVGQNVVWRCSNCGHLHEGPEALQVCPVCKHPQGYFEVKKNA